MVVESFEGETRFQMSPVLVKLGVASGISVVIPGEDRAFGVLAAYATRRRAFTPEDTQFVQAVANIVANAIRRQREEEARARLAAVLESSEDAIVSHSLEGVVETWNRGAEHVYGYSAAEMIGRSISVLLPADRIHEETSILEIIRRGEAVQAFETERVRKDGVHIQVSLTISPIRDRAGNVIAASHSGRDISERKRVEEKLQQTQKLESLGILAGGIAHDFNNLLTGILGNASLITEVLPPRSPARELAESVIQAAERAAHLTRQMLAYSGRGRFLIQPMNCSQQVREITALIAASIPKNVQVRLALADDLPLIEADTGQFQQLVMNLVINGAEAMGDAAGTVTISTGVEQIEAAEIAGMTFAARSQAGPLRLARSARHRLRHGSGHAGQDLRSVLHHQVHRPRAGAGGRAGHRARPYGRDQRAHRSGPGHDVPGAVSGGGGAEDASRNPCARSLPDGAADTILVVDDEDLVRRAAKASLEKYGYRVVLAEDGKRAVEIFRTIADEIAVVLLDMTMPVMSGEQTFQELRKIRPDLLVDRLQRLQRGGGAGAIRTGDRGLCAEAILGGCAGS